MRSHEPAENLSETLAILFALRAVVTDEHADVAVLGQVKENSSALKSSQTPQRFSKT